MHLSGLIIRTGHEKENSQTSKNVHKKKIDVIYQFSFKKYSAKAVSSGFFIDGPGGSGKTYLYTTLYYLVIGLKKNVTTMAFTGIATTLFPHEKTVHKTLGLSVPLYADSNSIIKPNSRESEILRDTDVFIWDESPIALRYSLEIMDRSLRDIMNNDLPFGGKLILMGGDFRQLPPVKVHSTRCEMINLFIKFSILWKNCKVFSLTENMLTVASEIEFSKFIIELGNGSLNDYSYRYLWFINY